jgi:hypothetical protein
VRTYLRHDAYARATHRWFSVDRDHTSRGERHNGLWLLRSSTSRVHELDFCNQAAAHGNDEAGAKGFARLLQRIGASEGRESSTVRCCYDSSVCDFPPPLSSIWNGVQNGNT